MVVDKTINPEKVLENKIRELGEAAGLEVMFNVLSPFGMGSGPAVGMGYFKTWRTGWWIFGKDHEKLVVKIEYDPPYKVELHDEEYRELAEKVEELIQSGK